MGVNHGGAHIGVAKQFLNGADIVTGREQMGRKRMAKAMAGHRFGDLRSSYRDLDRPLDHGIIKMMSFGPFATEKAEGKRFCARYGLLIFNDVYSCFW
jgi:hypothetical protein